MTLNEYQEKAMTTCMPTSNNFSYMMLNLVGEVGEFASKVAKAIRKNKLIVSENNLEYMGDPLTPEAIKKIKTVSKEGEPTGAEDFVAKMMIEGGILNKELMKEAGDILWQLSGLCKEMGWTLEEVAQQNLDKLASRQERNKIDGDGDNR